MDVDMDLFIPVRFNKKIRAGSVVNVLNYKYRDPDFEKFQFMGVLKEDALPGETHPVQVAGRCDIIYDPASRFL